MPKKPTKPGRKWSPTPKQQSMLEVALDGGFGRSVSYLCIQAGVSRPTFYDWLKEDENFRNEWDGLKEKILRPCLPGVYQAIKTKALAGDVQAAKLLLEVGGFYNPVQRHEHSGPDGKPIQSEQKIKMDLSILSDDELRQYQALMDKLASRGSVGVN